MEDRTLEIIKHFGVKNQLKKLNEEAYEFIEAVNDYEEQKCIAVASPVEAKKLPEYRAHVVEEMTDVAFLLEQFALLYKIENAEIQDEKYNKLVRTLKRIQTGYYEEAENDN